VTVLDQLNADIQVPPTAGQFACLCVLDGRKIDEATILTFFCALLRLGCAYLCCWGPDCERIHDLMDSEFEREARLESRVGCIMTTWHAQERLEDAVDFFLRSTYPDEGYAPAGCTWALAIAMQLDGWALQVRQMLTARLD
jgi:hypothetical protein